MTVPDFMNLCKYYSPWKLKVGPGKVLEFDLALPVWTLQSYQDLGKLAITIFYQKVYNRLVSNPKKGNRSMLGEQSWIWISGVCLFQCLVSHSGNRYLSCQYHAEKNDMAVRLGFDRSYPVELEPFHAKGPKGLWYMHHKCSHFHSFLLLEW